MRGGQGRQPLDVPLDGRVRHHCVFARMPGVFLNHVHGWTIWGGYGTLPLKPRFLVASDRSQVARRRVRLDLGDLGSLNSNSTSARTSLVPKPLPSCDAFASDWSIPRTPGSVSSSHHPSPLPRATYDWAYPIGSPFSIAMYGVTDSALKRLASTVPVRQQVFGAFFSAPPLDDMRSI